MAATVPQALREFFTAHPRLALAFSGGTDSAYLLCAALDCGCDVTAYYIASPFQPAFELEDARRLAEQLNAQLKVLPMDTLADPAIRANPADRCYHCKRAIFTRLTDAARADGRTTLIDGTNASDDAADRPGMKALQELQVRSPLRECGITKAMVREYSRQSGLFTWNKPAYACLATRVPAGTPLDARTLKRVEAAETALAGLGFSDFRCRVYHGAARLQFPAAQLEEAIRLRGAIRETLRPYFEIILIDTEDRG